jgi:hypothetical protein
MKVVLVGAPGLIGSAIASRPKAGKHNVTGGRRFEAPQGAKWCGRNGGPIIHSATD